MLYLVGKDITKHQARYRERRGMLARVARGIYVDPADDVETQVRRNAARIGLHLYQNAYLSHGSAVTGTHDSRGVLHLAGRHPGVVRLPGLEIRLHRRPPRPMLRLVEVAGEPARLACLEQAVLEMAASGLCEDERLEALRLLVARHGSREAVQARLDEAAAVLGWRVREEAIWDGWRPDAAEARRGRDAPALVSRLVGWHGVPVGRLSHTGSEWVLERYEGWLFPVPRWARTLPPSLANLLPEGWLSRALSRTDLEVIRHGRRLLSNLSLGTEAKALRGIPEDVLVASLARFTDEAGVFRGRIVVRSSRIHDVLRRVARLWDSETTPVISGAQPKVPVHLSRSGTVCPAVHTGWTHILKLPNQGAGFGALEALEWLGMRLAAAAGLETPPVALTRLDDGLPPALLVERFDIRRAADPADPSVSRGRCRWVYVEDGAAVMGLPPEMKASVSFEALAEALLARVTPARRDAEARALLARAFVTWAVGDEDAHAKNFALLHEAWTESRHRPPTRFDVVRLAPCYDVCCTSVLPHAARPGGLALTVRGRRTDFDVEDWRALGETLGLAPEDAERLVHDAAEGLAREASALRERLPEPIATHPECDELAREALDGVLERLASLRFMSALDRDDAPARMMEGGW